MFTYHQSLHELANLTDRKDWSNVEHADLNEYERGMVELIARLWGDSVLLTAGDTAMGVEVVLGNMADIYKH